MFCQNMFEIQEKKVFRFCVLNRTHKFFISDGFRFKMFVYQTFIVHYFDVQRWQNTNSNGQLKIYLATACKGFLSTYSAPQMWGTLQHPDYQVIKLTLGSLITAWPCLISAFAQISGNRRFAIWGAPCTNRTIRSLNWCWAVWLLPGLAC